MQLYTLFDKKTSSYGELIQNNHLAEVIRMLIKLLQNPEAKLSFFPEDYALYQVGTFDQASGQITPSHQPIFLMEVVSLVKNPNVQPQQVKASDVQQA